jgi:sulfite dehydrogenase
VVLALVAVSAASASNADDAGRRLFVKDATPPCALCHTLADAGATANVGPSLDELKPDAQRVTQAVKAGIGAMPAYTQLSAEQIQAIARYVSRASGGAK